MVKDLRFRRSRVQGLDFKKPSRACTLRYAGRSHYGKHAYKGLLKSFLHVTSKINPKPKLKERSSSVFSAFDKADNTIKSST